MLRTLIGALSAGALLAGGFAAAPAAGAQSASHTWGSTHGKSQPLRNGCHYYRYTYRIKVPGDDWAAELFLRNPRHVRLASAAYDAGTDPRHGTRFWHLCSPSTVHGRYKIAMKVTVRGDLQNPRSQYAHPSYFYLSKVKGGR